MKFTKPSREAPQRKIPVVTAVIAMIFFAAIVFGATSVILTNIRSAGSDGDMGLHLDGAWKTDDSTVNDEIISITFSGYAFTTVTERIFFDASPEALADLKEFYENYRGARVNSEDIGYGNYQIRIYENGEFALEGNSILLVLDNDLHVWMPFYWDDDAIIINGDRYLRQ